MKLRSMVAGHEIESPEILDAFCYLDTVCLLVPRGLVPNLRGVARYCRGRPHCRDSRYFGHSRVTMQQPTAEAFKLFPAATLVSRVDLALDLIGNSKDELESLFEWINARLVRPWRPKDVEIVWSDGTRYTDRRVRNGAPPPGVVSYIGTSKITGDVCCMRIEHRLLRAQSVRSALKIGNAIDLAGLDVAEFWARALPRMLKSVDLLALGKSVRGRSRARKSDTVGSNRSYDRDRAAGRLTARRAMYATVWKSTSGRENERLVSAQAVRDRCRLLEVELSTAVLRPVVVTEIIERLRAQEGPLVIT